VDPTLQLLLDERDITRLCYRYGSTLDDRDWAGLRTCFTDDAVTEYEGLGEFTGYDAIEKVCQAALGPLDRSQHLIGNVVVAVDGDTATAQCYLHAQHVKTGTPGGDLYVLAGRYTDSLARTPDGWRFTRRRLETWWTDGNPAVIST
jgi:ketosteroid isomerase-like protein